MYNSDRLAHCVDSSSTYLDFCLDVGPQSSREIYLLLLQTTSVTLGIRWLPSLEQRKHILYLIQIIACRYIPKNLILYDNLHS